MNPQSCGVANGMFFHYCRFNIRFEPIQWVCWFCFVWETERKHICSSARSQVNIKKARGENNTLITPRPFYLKLYSLSLPPSLPLSLSLLRLLCLTIGRSGAPGRFSLSSYLPLSLLVFVCLSYLSECCACPLSRSPWWRRGGVSQVIQRHLTPHGSIHMFYDLHVSVILSS